MTRALVSALAAVGLWAGGAAGVSPDPKDLVISQGDLAKARDLIRQLGSEAYRDREEAHAELTRMGRLARPALLEAAGSDPDPEVRFRCSRLLPKAAADDLKARLDTFLADTEGKYRHDLPGWDKFVAATRETWRVFGHPVWADKSGDDKARQLFIEVVKTPYNVELLRALDRTPAEAGRAVADRRMQLYAQINQRNNFRGGVMPPPQPITLPDVACLILAETVTPAADVPRAGPFSYVTGVTFLQQGGPATSALSANSGLPHAEAYRRIVGRWMETREEPNDLAQLCYVAGQLLRNFPQSTPLLRRIVATDAVQGYAKGEAIRALVQGPNGGKNEIPFVTRLLTNETLATTVWFGGGPNQNQQYQCLVRDVALAHLVTLTGQRMEDYGFKAPNGQVPVAAQLHSYAFTSDRDRAAAMVKYGFWRLKQELKDPAAEPKK
ncbi:MAG: hypothetical protein C0501_15415 [Isosphaera sp.]|nr:hypothetical protein [Isosphaera sp.]